jgi:hypothetical protein
VHFLYVYRIDQQIQNFDNLLIHFSAATCFDLCTPSSGSLLLCVPLSYIKMCIVMTYTKEVVPQPATSQKLQCTQLTPKTVSVVPPEDRRLTPKTCRGSIHNKVIVKVKVY